MTGRRRCSIVHQDGSKGRLLEVGCLRTAQPVRVSAVSPRELTGRGRVFSGGWQVAQELDPSVQPVNGLNFNSSVVEDVYHSALSGAQGPGCAELRGVSAVAGFG